MSRRPSFNLILRLRLARCCLAHRVEPYRGGWRCLTCAPVRAKRKVAAPEIDPRQQPLPIEAEPEGPQS
jgi:hypothetical protein